MVGHLPLRDRGSGDGGGRGVEGRKSEPRPQGPHRRDLPRIMQFCVNFDAVYLAERHITSGVVATVFALLVIPSSLLAWVWLGQRPTARFAWSSLVAVAGIMLLFVHELHDHAASARQVVSGIAHYLHRNARRLDRQRDAGAARNPALSLCSHCSPGRWPPVRVIDGIIALLMTGPPVLRSESGLLGGSALSGACRVGPDLQSLLSRDPQDRPSEDRLFERRRPDHRHGLFDLARRLSLDSARDRRRRPCARRHGGGAQRQADRDCRLQTRPEALGGHMPSSVIRRFVYCPDNSRAMGRVHDWPPICLFGRASRSGRHLPLRLFQGHLFQHAAFAIAIRIAK